MPAKGRGIHHIDLAVSDVEQSIAFYLDLLGPLGHQRAPPWAVATRSSFNAAAMAANVSPASRNATILDTTASSS